MQRLVDWAPAAQDCWLSSRRTWIFMRGECAKSATASRLGACGARLLARHAAASWDVQRLVDWSPAAQDCWLSSRRRWIFMIYSSYEQLADWAPGLPAPAAQDCLLSSR